MFIKKINDLFLTIIYRIYWLFVGQRLIRHPKETQLFSIGCSAILDCACRRHHSFILADIDFVKTSLKGNFLTNAILIHNGILFKLPILVRWDSKAVRKALSDTPELLSEYDDKLHYNPNLITFGLNTELVKKYHHKSVSFGLTKK